VIEHDLPVIVDAPDAPLGTADVTRRRALVFPDGRMRFPGVTRPEGERAAGTLAALGSVGWDRALIEIRFPVLLSDGAGPHLVDAEGRLVLAVAEHPGLPGLRVALGPAGGAAGPAGAEAVGLVRRAGPGAWVWSVRAVVPAEERVPALGDLDASRNSADLDAWRARWE
jgi:hypothetical protein